MYKLFSLYYILVCVSVTTSNPYLHTSVTRPLGVLMTCYMGLFKHLFSTYNNVYLLIYTSDRKKTRSFFVYIVLLLDFDIKRYIFIYVCVCIYSTSMCVCVCVCLLTPRHLKCIGQTTKKLCTVGHV